MGRMADVVIPPGYVYEAVQFTHVGLGHICIMTFGWEIETPPFTQAAANALLLDHQDELKVLWDSEVTIGPAHYVVGNDGPPNVYDAAGVVVGTNTSAESCPPNVCEIVRKRTGLGGREFRGRGYMPFVREPNVDQAGNLTAGVVSSHSATWDQFRVGAIANGTANVAEMVLLHSATQAGGPPDPTIITSLAVAPRVGTQRRRLRT